MDEKQKQPFKSGYVAIVGQPNVGKSTLLNHLLNFKLSSVTKKPQTTRQRVLGILNGENYQVVFLDTPGLLEPKYKLQEAMLQAVQRSLKDADLVLYMVTAKPQPDPEDVGQIDRIAALKQRIVLVINKIDLVDKEQLLPLIDAYRKFDYIRDIVPISALRNSGLRELQQVIIDALPEGFPFYDQELITNHPERFLVAELIREKIFLLYSDEIPYATTVTIDEFKERPGQKDYIKATILVEKNTQKQILIGKKGKALKRVGQSARQEIEATLGRPVYLELWVKVKEKWRQDEQLLKKLGFYSS